MKLIVYRPGLIREEAPAGADKEHLSRVRKTGIGVLQRQDKVMRTSQNHIQFFDLQYRH
jgi:hypothetical protein